MSWRDGWYIMKGGRPNIGPFPTESDARQSMVMAREKGLSPDGIEEYTTGPRFSLGDKVVITDLNRSGVISFVGQYDDHIGQYRYKVSDEVGQRKTWNENSLAMREDVDKRERDRQRG